MAFSFGATPASGSTGLFGASTPAFGSSTPAFGTSTPPFGASAPAFGSSTPAFGASAPFSFSGVPQSSAAFSTGLFGAPSQPAFGASQPAGQPFRGGLFGASSTPSLFGASTPAAGGLFVAPSSQPASSPFTWGAQPSPQPNINNALVPFTGAAAPGQPQQQQQQQSAVNIRALVTTQGSWIHHSTTWDEIHPEGQKQLLEFEKLLMQQRTHCQELDSCTRLHSLHQESQEERSGMAGTKQALSRVTSRQGVDDSAAAALRERVSDLMQHVHAAVRALQRSSVFLRQGAPSQAIPAGVMEQLAGPVTLPSHYLRSTVTRFQEVLAQLEQVVAEHQDVLERREQREGESQGGVGDLAGTLYSLQDFLLGTAARLEGTQQRVASAKEAVLCKRREAGNLANPFVEAEQREAARSEEPSVHRKPAAQAAPGLSAAGQASGAATASQPAASGGSFSFNLGAASSPAPAGGLFSTPALAASGASTGGLFASPFGANPSPGITTRSVARKTANKKRS